MLRTLAYIAADVHSMITTGVDPEGAIGATTDCSEKKVVYVHKPKSNTMIDRKIGRATTVLMIL